MKELKSSLDTIRKTASELITGIEDRLAELHKDRAVEQEQNDDLTQYSRWKVNGRFPKSQICPRMKLKSCFMIWRCLMRMSGLEIIMRI